MREKISYYDLEAAESMKKFQESISEKTKFDYQERVEQNPVPTKKEERMGLFIEEIVPQSREAFDEMYDRGYTVYLAEFDGENHAMQGKFILDDETKKNLFDSDFKIEIEEKKPGITKISFKSDKCTIGEVAEQWKQIISIIPDKGEPATLASYNGAIAFREKYMPEDWNVRVDALKDRIERTKHKKRKEILKNSITEEC